MKAIVYRFTIREKDSNIIKGSGIFKSNGDMTSSEALSFFHEYTHGMYVGRENYYDIVINKEL